MDENTLYLLQLLGSVSAGGFVGEFFRASRNASIGVRVFIANFLAGSFLSYLIAYTIYLTLNQREVSIIIGALLSYQDERFISDTARKLILNWVSEGVKKDD